MTDLSKNNIEDELVTAKSVLCLCGIGTTKKKLKKLSKVLMKFPKKFVSSNMIILNSITMYLKDYIKVFGLLLIQKLLLKLLITSLILQLVIQKKIRMVTV